MDTGYYWCYTLRSDGSRLENDSEPSIVYYNAFDGTVSFTGVELACDYHPKNYELIRKIEFNRETP